MTIDICGALVLDGDFDARESRAKLAKDGGKVVKSDGVDCDDSERAGGGLGETGDADVNVLKDIEDVAGGLIKELTLRGESDAATETFEEGDAKSLFQ